MDRPFYVYAGGVGGIGSWCHRKPCSGLDSKQDQTLQFMIKLLAIAITLMVSYPWLSGILLNYTRQIMLRIGEHG